MNAIPDGITEWLQPAAKPLLKFKRVSCFHIIKTASFYSVPVRSVARQTVPDLYHPISTPSSFFSVSSFTSLFSLHRIPPNLTSPGPTRPHLPHPRRRLPEIQRRQNHHLSRNPLLEAPRHRQIRHPSRRRSPNRRRRRRRNNRLCPVHCVLPHHQHTTHIRAPARRPRRCIPEPRHAGTASVGDHAVPARVHPRGRTLGLRSQRAESAD
jgi:hypothetical protein